jgi:hypothetical protein
MSTINITPTNYGMNVVRNVGFQLRTLIGTLDFDSNYSSGGETFDLSNYFKKEVTGVIPFPKSGYQFEYDEDNKKIKVFKPAPEIINAASETYTVADDDAPGGNALYVNVDSDGNIYFECNMANDEEDKEIQFDTDGPILTIKHVASPEGTQVYFDEDGTQPDRLLADIEDDLYVPTDTLNKFMKVNADSSASSNGVAINYDDDADEQLEATTDGNSNADLDLAENINDFMKEVQDGVDLSSITGVRFIALGR